MRTKDIAKNYRISQIDFEYWLVQTGREHNSGKSGMSVGDGVNTDELVRAYNEHVADLRVRGSQERVENQAKLEREWAEEQAILAQQRAEDEAVAGIKQQALAGMLITSGFAFDGYTITKYSGYISGDDAVSMNRPSQGWFGGIYGDVGTDLLKGLAQIRRNALAELKEAAYALDCNAVIGVDFDYLTLDPETAGSNGGTLYLPFLFAVTANGNAVVIEKK